MSGHKTAGAGSPVWFNCPGCYRVAGFKPVGAGGVTRTGHFKPRKAKSGSAMGIRNMREMHQYYCERCGHVGWSSHKDILIYPLKFRPMEKANGAGNE